MAHEIQERDGLVLAKQSAWHGLGIIVPDTFTPTQGLELAGLDRSVECFPLSAMMPDGSTVPVKNNRAVMYRDESDVLGIVSDNWTPIQNRELADFCEALAEAGDTVKCETVGSIRNGAKVWFLLRGESFSVRNHGDDEIKPYILASNGHDGKTSLRFTNTTVRVVCSNTLHMVIPREEGLNRNKMEQSSFSCCHVGSRKRSRMQSKLSVSMVDRSKELDRSSTQWPRRK